MSFSFHNADSPTHRRVMLVGLMSCALFVMVSFLAREQPAHGYALQKADRLVRTADTSAPAN